MAMSSDEKNSLDLDRAHIELNDDERTASSPLIISLSDVGEDEPDRNESSHVPSRITFCDRLPKYKSCAEHPTSPVLPAATRDQSMLPLTGLKQLPNTTSILLYGLVRCIITWFLIAGFYLSFWWYKNKVISPGEKTMFDAVNVVLSIAFGLNIASSLKEIALYFRWWILDYRRRPSQEVEFILHCDSMTDLLKMMWNVPRLGTVAACMTWLAINILAQTGIACLGFTYSAVPGPEDVYLGSAMKNISIPNLEQFAPPNNGVPNDSNGESFHGESSAAHILGDIGSSYNYTMRPEQNLKGLPWASNPSAFLNATDHWEYVSLNSTPLNNNNSPGILSVYTDRIIISSGVCTTPAYQLKLASIPATGAPMLNLSSYSIMAAEFMLLDSGETVPFPLDALNVEGTYYLSSSYNNSVCGPGCGNIKIVETATGPPALGSFVGNGTNVYFYDCNITVTSLSDPFPGSLPPEKASLAARAIGLSGALPQLGGDWEYVYYQMYVAFGKPQYNSAIGMAHQLSRFAIGVIAAAAQTNEPKIVLGRVPTQGLRLTLDHPLAFGLILGLTGSIQLLLVLFTAITCGKLDIPKEISQTRRATFKRFILPD